ncbi:hypothetical protein MD484_g6279, partial [Candolleomyces efflorescens]
MAACVPETAPFVRAAAIASPGLMNFPTPVSSVAMQMQRLVYGPLKLAADRGPIDSLAGRPFLIIIDGLDECEDKDEVGELIDSMLAFFADNPFIPLRVFITSRVEQHIHSRLNVDGVNLDNLADHCSNDDITAFLEVLFQDAGRRNPVIQAYVREHGEWPTPDEQRSLVYHIGGSFIFASAVFKFIIGSNAPRDRSMTPMDRLPLALKMNPGLDGLYAQTLERSENIPHFSKVISTIALLEAPLPTSGIAEVLGIRTYEVVNVLVELQAIIQVPGTDDIPVTLCHTSLRDFLTTESRSGRFFTNPRHHVYLYLRFIKCEYELHRQRPGVAIHPSECTPAIAYSRTYSVDHLNKGQRLIDESEVASAIRLCREALSFHPDGPEQLYALANAIYWSSSTPNMSPLDLDEAIALYQKAISLQPLAHEGRWLTLHSLGYALMDRYSSTGAIGDLEEAIDTRRESLKLQPPLHPERSNSLTVLAVSLKKRYRCNRVVADLEEAISLFREALELRPLPHPDRAASMDELSAALMDRCRCNSSMVDLEEVISLDREALNLRPLPHPRRSSSLANLTI